MPQELVILIGTAAVLALTHTLVGPDHYVPFIVMAKARNWSIARTSIITFLCGIGHVLSSIVLGVVGIAVGMALGGLEFVEAMRGDIAAWLLTSFGLVYMVWGIRRAIRNRPHTHGHRHLRESDRSHEHTHEHVHEGGHTHVHEAHVGSQNLTPWILFTIFVFGPCEALIPMLMYPAARLGLAAAATVAAVFAAVTILTMMGCVLAATFALRKVPLNGMERYSHAMAGAAICLCGVLIHVGL